MRGSGSKPPGGSRSCGGRVAGETRAEGGRGCGRSCQEGLLPCRVAHGAWGVARACTPVCCCLGLCAPVMIAGPTPFPARPPCPVCHAGVGVAHEQPAAAGRACGAAGGCGGRQRTAAGGAGSGVAPARGRRAGAWPGQPQPLKACLVGGSDVGRSNRVDAAHTPPTFVLPMHVTLHSEGGGGASLMWHTASSQAHCAACVCVRASGSEVR